MAELRRLARQGIATIKAPWLVAVGAVMASSCATSPTPLQDKIEPRIAWVLDDLHSVGGETPRVLGAPTVEREGGRAALRFDGAHDALIFETDPLRSFRRFTIEILFRADPDGEAEQRFFHVEDQAGQRALIELRLDPTTRRWSLDTYLHASIDHRRTLLDRSKTHPTGEWHWVALVYDGSIMAHYVNGQKELEGVVRFPPMSEGKTSIGTRLNRVNWFKGAIREVRIYDRALAPDQLSR